MIIHHIMIIAHLLVIHLLVIVEAVVILGAGVDAINELCLPTIQLFGIIQVQLCV